MKTLSILFVICLSALGYLQSQPYQITFTGSGLSSTVATVEVQNLTQGTTLTLAGTDILELVTTIGISDHLTTKGEILIYPNPAESTSRLEFYIQQPGDVRIELFDATGKLLLRKDEYLLEGNHSYRLGGLKSGVYFLKVSTPAGSYSERVISTGNAQGVPVLEYTGMTPQALHQAKLTSTAGIIQMQYNAGEMLLFKGISGNYSRVITLLPTQSQSVDFVFVACTDGDGNHYPVVTIGTQTWMAENLKTTKYSNSAAIPLVTDNKAWLYPWLYLSTGARCWYNNDSATYANTYGALYSWFAVVNSNGICPTGWHVPTDAEWTILTDFLGGESVAGGPLKETDTAHWYSPNTGATNSSGFTALPGGGRGYNNNGNFYGIGSYGYWWSSTQGYYPAWALYRGLDYSNSWVSNSGNQMGEGFSVRCLRDSTSSSASLPSVITDSASSITSNSAISGGNITSDGGAAVTAKGVCWSTNPNPTTADNHTTDGTGTGTFTSNLSGLQPATTYYVRAYATNSAGTAYGNQVDFTTTGSATGVPCPGMPTMVDYNGNIYNTVQIGTQCWMKENLKVRNYKNGAPIPNITANSTWTGLSTGAMCWYNNDSATYANTYGALYNWFAVDNSSGICPTGWHVPTDLEWQTLEMHLGMTQSQANSTGWRGTDEGGKMKEAGTAHWYSPNTGATNSSGFTALPGGGRYDTSGGFHDVGSGGGWWSSAAYSTAGAWGRILYYDYSNVYRSYEGNGYGTSVRCLRD